MKYRGLLGKTKKQQIAKARKLLDYLLSPGDSPAGRLDMIMNMLGCPDCEPETNYECGLCRSIRLGEEY